MQHQQGKGQEQHDRNACGDRGRALAAFRHGAGHFDAVATRALGLPLCLQRPERRPQLSGHGRALQAFDDVALNRDRIVAVIPPHHPGFPGKHGLGDLRQRNRFARSRWHISIAHVGDGVALLQRLTQHDLDEFVPFAELSDSAATEHVARGLGDGLAGYAQGAGLGLVNLQPQNFHGLIPVVIDAAHVGVLTHHGLDLISALTQNQRIRPHHLKLHRVGNGRAVGQQLHAATHLGELTCQQGRKFDTQ